MTFTAEEAFLDTAEVEAFSERLFEAGLVAVELVDVVLGARLGLYAALAEAGPSTPAELALRCGIAERYAREWLEQQTAADILVVDDVAAADVERRYRLTAARAHVLLDQGSEAHMLPLLESAAVAATWLPMLEHAYRSGAGIPYADYAVHDLQAAFSRSATEHHLTQRWLPALSDLHARLATGAATVAEVGCGEGLAAVTIAKAFPGVRIDACDTDDASIAAARRLAAAAGVSDRVRFEVRDALVVDRQGRYDLVLCIEMLHDTADPVGVLTAMRRLRADGGTVLVVDERVAPAFALPVDPVERLLYAFSTLHCLPVGMAAQPSAATGAVMRQGTLRRYAADAGFSSVDELAVDHLQFRLYRLEG